jgi:uncharacterized glyoxalase superfamily protein PhnB
MLSIKYLEFSIRALEFYKKHCSVELSLAIECEDMEKAEEWTDLLDTYAEMIVNYKLKLDQLKNQENG